MFFVFLLLGPVSADRRALWAALTPCLLPLLAHSDSLLLLSENQEAACPTYTQSRIGSGKAGEETAGVGRAQGEGGREGEGSGSGAIGQQRCLSRCRVTEGGERWAGLRTPLLLLSSLGITAAHRWVEHSGQRKRIDGYQFIAYLSDAKAFSVEIDLVPPSSWFSKIPFEARGARVERWKCASAELKQVPGLKLPDD